MTAISLLPNMIPDCIPHENFGKSHPMLPPPPPSPPPRASSPPLDLDASVTRDLANLTTLSQPTTLRLTMLPSEVLARILRSLASTAHLQSAAAAARSCRALRDAAAWCWHEIAQAMLGSEQRWNGSHVSYRDIQGAWDVSHVEWQLASPLLMPNPSFAHSSVVWQGMLYLFGGRNDADYWCDAPHSCRP